MTSVVQTELFQWVDNEMLQISSGLSDGSKSIEDACRFMTHSALPLTTRHDINFPMPGKRSSWKFCWPL